MTSLSALSPDPSSGQAQRSLDRSDHHFSRNVEPRRQGPALISTVWEWHRCPGPGGKETCPVVSLFFLFWWEKGAGEQKWYQDAGNTCFQYGRPSGSHSTLVTAFGPDLALPPDTSRAQGYQRGTGQCRKVHHSLPVVSDSGGGRGALRFPTRLTNIWTNHRSPFLGSREECCGNASGTFLVCSSNRPLGLAFEC